MDLNTTEIPADTEAILLNRVKSVSGFSMLANLDATQAAGKVPIDVYALEVDFAAFSAHKICGPKGAGALYVRQTNPPRKLLPLLYGGGQERGLRGGTLNVPAIAGFGEACRIARLEMDSDATRISCLRDKLEADLRSELPEIRVHGDIQRRICNTSNIAFRGVEARALIRDMYCLAVSTRSACSSAASGPSHVLKAIRLTDDEAYSSVRFSLGRFTTEEDIQTAVGLVVRSVRKLQTR